MAAALARVRHVATMQERRGSIELRRPIWVYRRLPRAGVSLVDALYDLATFPAGGLGIAQEHLTVVHNAISALRDRPPAERATRRAALCRELGVADNTAVVLAVGNFHPMKNPAMLLRAVARLDPAFPIAIAGRGNEDQRLRALTREADRPKRRSFEDR